VVHPTTVPTRQTGRQRTSPPLHAVLTVVLIAFLAPVLARAHSAESLQQFEMGKKAVAAQDFAAALDAFEAAAVAGMSGPAVQFNIGVCAYRLGRWSRARAAFREVARTPDMAALAHYNLGLVALGGGKRDEAARWFAQAERETADDGLRSLATRQLAQLPRPRERNWVAFGSFAAGYDDNVALVSGGDVLGVSGTDDAFGELQLAAAGPLIGPWRFDGGIVLLDYQDLDSFDQLTANGGARYRLPLGDWTGEAALQLLYSTLDSEGFENKRMLLLQASRALTQEWRLRARYRFSDIDGLDGFQGLDGYRHELGIRGVWHRDSWDVSLEYKFDTSDYDDESLSFSRHQLGVDVQRDLNDRWTVHGGLSFDRSRYDVASNGSEERFELTLAASRSLNDTWRVVVRYAYADNQADLPEFNYQRNLVSAGVEAAW
jgi:tetratricopeptide (TPR) repeat protein